MLYFTIISALTLLLITLVLVQNPRGTSQLVTKRIGVKNHLTSTTWIAGLLIMIIALVG